MTLPYLLPLLPKLCDYRFESPCLGFNLNLKNDLNSRQVIKEMHKLRAWRMGPVDEPARFFALFIWDACEHASHLFTRV